jgi:hypothetical protein
VVAQLTAQGVEMPSRVGLVPGGMVAFDGDQLTINLTGITRGFPGRPDGTALNPTLTKMFYDSARCQQCRAKDPTAASRPRRT